MTLQLVVIIKLLIHFPYLLQLSFYDIYYELCPNFEDRKTPDKSSANSLSKTENPNVELEILRPKSNVLLQIQRPNSSYQSQIQPRTSLVPRCDHMVQIRKTSGPPIITKTSPREDKSADFCNDESAKIILPETAVVMTDRMAKVCYFSKGEAHLMTKETSF